MKTLLEIKDDVCKNIFHFRYKNLLEKLSSNNHNFTETEIDHFINEVAYTLHEPSSPTVKEKCPTCGNERRIRVLEDALRSARKRVSEAADMFGDTNLPQVQKEFNDEVHRINKVLNPVNP